MRSNRNILPSIFTILFISLLITALNAAEIPPVGQKPGPLPAGDEEITADVFGEKGGRYHPFLLLEGVYNDNFFATNTDTKDDFITTIAPGIWLAFPANREKLLSIDTSTTSPGGLRLSRVKPAATRRYQTYFLYSPEFVLYSSHSTHDHINHKAEALFQYNWDSGISFDVIDIFRDREEIAGNGITDTLYRHQDNLLDFITSYNAPSGKLKAELHYSNYDLDYKDEIVEYRDRNDNTYGIAVFYKFWPKTSLFAEYNYADIDYDAGITNDSVEHRYYGGIQWDMTAKTRGTLKVGYIDKDFDLATVNDEDDYSIEIQTQHNLTTKRALQVNGYRKFHESDLANASSYLSTGIDIGLMQRFREKWSGTLNVLYENNEYNTIDRDDDLFGIGAAIRFEPRKWLIFDLGYHFYNNDSNLNGNDYEMHQIYLRASLSM